MTNQTRKTLSLKQPASNPAESSDAETPARKRTGKRIIRREQLPQQSLATTKKPLPKAAKRQKTKKSATATKKQGATPSDLRLVALDKQLSEVFSIWSEHQPLALGIEKSIFRFIAEHHISASKRVVQKLLKRHTAARSYRANVLQQAQRYELDGTPAGMISQLEKDHAQRQMDVVHSV